MFVEIWTNDVLNGAKQSDNKIVRHIMVRNILAIEAHANYNTCVVKMLDGYKYSHHESAQALVKRIKEIQNGH